MCIHFGGREIMASVVEVVFFVLVYNFPKVYTVSVYYIFVRLQNFLMFFRWMFFNVFTFCPLSNE